MPVLTGRTRVLGVMGHPVEHSLSPAMQNAALAALSLDFVYVPFAVAPDDLARAMDGVRSLGIVGVNLTIPHKERALALMDRVAPDAAAVGAVNTVANVDGVLVGYNTDGDGFAAPLAEAGIAVDGLRAVVLGAGGAARSVVFRLAADGADVAIYNRSAERAARLAEAASKQTGGRVRALGSGDELREAMGQAGLLVNATSVGMAPRDGELPPIPADALHPGLVVYDLVYRPLETALLRAARGAGCRVLTGDRMLVHQGARSLSIWTGRAAPIDVMTGALRAALSG
jgi:shikimate dehydrogenase